MQVYLQASLLTNLLFRWAFDPPFGNHSPEALRTTRTARVKHLEQSNGFQGVQAHAHAATAQPKVIGEELHSVLAFALADQVRPEQLIDGDEIGEQVDVFEFRDTKSSLGGTGYKIPYKGLNGPTLQAGSPFKPDRAHKAN